MKCPDCKFENIPGADSCEQCGQPLCALSAPVGNSSLAQRISKDRIRDLTPREPLVVEQDTPVSMVIKLLYEHSVGCAIVVDKEHNIQGIFSERDALMRLGPDAASKGDEAVSNYMTPEPETLEMRDKIAFAIHKMDLGGYRHIPITEKDKVRGVISVRDIVKYITELIPAT